MAGSGFTAGDDRLDRMAYDDLRSLLRALERDGDLKRIKVEVDPHLEVGEIVDRVNKAGGPALLFENVKGASMPLAMNVFGTDRRLLKALGLSSYDEISDRIGGLLKPQLPQGFVGVREAFGKLGTMVHVPPKKVKTEAAPVQEVVLTGDDVDLDRLPALFTWPEDGGSFFNLGLTHTRHPETGVRNLGLYRLQRHDKRTIGMHWQIHKDSRNHYAVAARKGERLPVAIAFGAPPAVTYASTAPLPEDIDEYLFIGFVQGKRIEMVDCRTVPLQSPPSRSRPRGLAGAGRDAARGPLRRPHRLLHPAGTVPRTDDRLRHHAPAVRCSSRSSSAVRRPRTARWAGRRNASSCRCSRSSFRTSWTTTCPSRAASTTARSSRSTRSTRSTPRR